MNIFRKYTRKSLAANRSRTLVTIIGIVLSMALLTAVIEGAYSGAQFMLKNEIANKGRWEAYFSQMDDEKLAKLKSDPDVDEIVSWKHLGAADTGSTDDYSKYLLINSIDKDFYDMVSVNISEGRLPENENEIIVPHNMPRHLGSCIFKVGDIIELSVGKRVSDTGEYLFTDPIRGGEKLTDTADKSYTVVGIYNRLDSKVVSYSTPGYIALTAGGEGTVTGSFVTLKDPSKAYQFQASRGGDKESPQYISKVALHDDLLNMKGTVRNNRIQMMIYSFAAILVVLVAFGSVSLIYNSFSISLAERTRQFGILKSVGATKKQLKSSVIYEALVLGAIGIPIGLVVGCAGIGTALYLLRDNFRTLSYANSVDMKLEINPIALIIAAAVCLIVIIISAWIPAARAVRIQPIEAIRQNADTKVKAREVRTSKLTLKLFGFEGAMASKNFRRNAKRYRTTVISLFMSIVLFISASSFCTYLTDSVTGIVSDGVDADVVVTCYKPSTEGDERVKLIAPEEFSLMVSGVSGIDKTDYSAVINGSCFASPSVLSKKYLELEPLSPDAAADEIRVYPAVYFINDDEFRQMLRDNGLKESDYFNTSAPKGVVYNSMVARVSENGSAKYYKVPMFEKKALPMTVKHSVIKEVPGYAYNEELDESGNNIIVYYPSEYYYQAMRSGEKLDTEKGMSVPYNEAFYFTDMNVAAEVETVCGMVSSQDVAIIYPYSMLEHVFMDDEALSEAAGSIVFGIRTAQSTEVTKQIKEIFTEKRMAVSVFNAAEERNTSRMIVTVVNVFAYGFIILISLIALANVFNTISTSIMLRRREFAMLKSIGLSKKGFSKMMNFECLIYGARSLLFGLPVAIGATYIIWRATSEAFETGFYLPVKGVVIAVASVFIVVFATMLYATSRIRKDNTIDALRNENL